MSAPVCAFEGCGRPVTAKGLCTGHYAQQGRGETLRPLRPRRRSGEPRSRCSFEGCDRPVKAHGLCVAHYTQMLRGQTLRPLLRPRGPTVQRNSDGSCLFEGCGRPVTAKGLCTGHYSQSRRGETLRPIRPRRPRGSAEGADS